ncbi:MAG: AAA family ATPase [Candidatus Bathyarchaeota archaeon]|nr:AAA family ATPase [Candidatus Bathyarchaeota archaeon]
MPAEIIADPEVLEEDYIPQSVPCRDVQRAELVDCLSPFKKRIKPCDCLCHGQSGTGKTTLVKYVLEQIEENTIARAFYVNCWENRTLSTVLDKLLEQADLIVSEVGYTAKVARLKERIGGKVCIIALDEVDKIGRKELDDILYILKDLGKVGIVCISNTRRYVLTLDPRIMSRLNLRSINFPKYSDAELLAILKYRVEDCRALYPKTCSEELLKKIADLAAGDARIAIQTLRGAACNAERANKSRITYEDVGRGFEEVKEIKKKYDLEALTPHHRLILTILKEHGEISSTEFHGLYKKEADKQGLKAKSQRSFNKYIADLIKLNRIEVDRAKMRGNVRLFRCV